MILIPISSSNTQYAEHKRKLFEDYKAEYEKIYEFVFNRRKVISLHENGLKTGNIGIMYVVKEVLPKVVSLAKRYPRVAESALKTIFNSTDELVAFMSDCSYTSKAMLIQLCLLLVF